MKLLELILNIEDLLINDGFYNKIRDLRKMIDDGGYNVLIEVDGGIDTENAADLIRAGVNVLVAGNSVFNSPDPQGTIQRLKKLFYEKDPGILK